MSIFKIPSPLAIELSKELQPYIEALKVRSLIDEEAEIYFKKYQAYLRAFWGGNCGITDLPRPENPRLCRVSYRIGPWFYKKFSDI